MKIYKKNKYPIKTYNNKDISSTKNFLYKITGEQEICSPVFFFFYWRYYFIASQLAWIASATSLADFPLV